MWVIVQLFTITIVDVCTDSFSCNNNETRTTIRCGEGIQVAGEGGGRRG